MSIALALLVTALTAQTPEGMEYFESNVRPLFVRHCHNCHSSKAAFAFAGLRLDSAAAVTKGGDTGPVIVPGKPRESKLIRALQGDGAKQMPPSGRLPSADIEKLTRWVEMGAPWPRGSGSQAVAAGFDLDQRRKQHWAWQPVKVITPPSVRDANWPLQPVDRFLLARMEAANVKPAPPAAKLTLLRRLTFDLTGLPPTPDEIGAYENDSAPGAYERAVDRLLASPHYGERMARRWMDVIRFAESHGSEGDPDTPSAYRYRDYLIRAFNADVPYDQLIREHLAGDLLPTPRLNPAGRLNESLIGTAHFRMVEHGFQPVEPWEDRIKWTDNQIDVFSKAFQGLTVSCARCHDHKFDAISQKDFYALFGIFYNMRPTQNAVDDPETLLRNRDALEDLRAKIRRQLAALWREDARRIGESLPADVTKESLLYPLSTPGIDVAAWLDDWRKEYASRRDFNAKNFTPGWDLTNGGYSNWLRQGVGAPSDASKPGEFSIEPSGPQILRGIYPAGAYSHLTSRKHGAVISSPRFKIESDSISLRFLGGNFAFAQLIIENYAVPRSGIYNLRHTAMRDEMGWAKWDTTFWKGFTAYVEFSTLGEVTHFQIDDELAKLKPVPKTNPDGRSWFGVQQVVFHNNKLLPKEEATPLRVLFESAPPAARAEYTAHLQSLTARAVDAWEAGTATGNQAALLDFCVRNKLLNTDAGRIPLVAEYRKLEQEIAIPRRAPGVVEEAGLPQPLLARGDPKQPKELIPRRYLTALDSEPYRDPLTMRLQLAQEVAAASNPLTARVIVNRLWQFAFRSGIVRTVDNFGKLGDTPTHPELLDWLAHRFVQDGWSVKKMMRMLLTSQAYRMSDAPNDRDPANALFSRVPLRRMEAEEVRDAILASAGTLDLKMFGKSVPAYYAHDTGSTKGDRPKGPLDGNGRRSIYLEVRRNATNPFLEAFDVYKPTSTRGIRDVTTVPAQSLALMNSAFVVEQASKWAAANPTVEAMYLRVFGRAPTPGERDAAETFLAEWRRDQTQAQARASLAQALWNLKEFLYVR